MRIFPSLPEAPSMIDVFRKFPDGLLPLCEYHDAILRCDSPLTVAERELIAAYVSGTNACDYCFGAHRQMAAMNGIDQEILESLMHDPGSVVEPKLLPILDYVKKLTLTPSRMTETDAEAVFAAGWPEQALFHAVAVCALFNCMNRMVDGTGITTSPEMNEDRQARLEATAGNACFYTDFARLVLDKR